MDRRALLATVGTAALVGCLSTPETEPTESDSEESDHAAEERVRECEKAHLEDVMNTDDQTLDGPLSPRVVSTESREEGEYIELETYFTVVRAPLRDDEPEEHGHGDVTAYYLVDGDDVYRIAEHEDGDHPKDGTELDC